MKVTNEKEMVKKALIGMRKYLIDQDEIKLIYEISDNYQAICDDTTHLEFAEDNGIYVFYRNEELIYIGYSDQYSKGGIGKRVKSHYIVQNGKVHFEWNIANYEIDDIDDLIGNGFNVMTIKIEPSFCSSLIETYLLTAYYKHYGRLPIFNRKI